MSGWILGCVVLLYLGRCVYLGWKDNEEIARRARHVPENFSGSGRRATKSETQIRTGLTVSFELEDLATPDEKQKQEVASCFVSGNFFVSRDNHAAQWLIRLEDITDNVNDPMPVFCVFEDCRDENGGFEFRHKTVIPYRSTSVKELLVAKIPLFTLICAKRGRRTLRVHVHLVDGYSSSIRLVAAVGELSFEQRTVGYTELKQHSLKQEEYMASLAIAMAATDGKISRRETNLIKTFFTNRYLQFREPTEHKARANSALKQAISRMQNSVSSRELIDEFCTAIRSLDQSSFNREAYELCARVAAADQKLDEQEENALGYIAKRLQINEKIVKQIHQREIRLHMFNHRSATLEQQLQVPEGLSDSEKLDWLTEEYGTWRKRTALSNVEVATEANMRIELLLELIAALESEMNGR